MEELQKPSFTKAMRKATREIHDISDTLVNAKLGIALTDDAVWAEGILYFYEIFKFLEEALDRLGHTLLGGLDIDGMRRTKAFKEDLDFYYGKDWMDNVYKPKPAVAEYIEYLEKLEKDDPYMLAAYIYHLYMGLFSGGQILRKKRSIESTLKLRSGQNSGKGESGTSFGTIPIHKLKKEMVEAMEYIAEQLGEEDRRKLIEESKHVFSMNNKMIRTIESANRVFWQKTMKYASIALIFSIVAYLGRKVVYF